MPDILEYFLLNSEDQSAAAVMVSAVIDGKAGLVSDIRVNRDALIKILDQFLNENTKYMTFDEHPKRLVEISLITSTSGLQVRIKAKSLTPEDQHAMT